MSGSGVSWAVCKSAPCCRQITMPAPNHSVFLQAGCPSCRPTNSVKALKANHYITIKYQTKIDLLLKIWNSRSADYLPSMLCLLHRCFTILTCIMYFTCVCSNFYFTVWCVGACGEAGTTEGQTSSVAVWKQTVQDSSRWCWNSSHQVCIMHHTWQVYIILFFCGTLWQLLYCVGQMYKYQAFQITMTFLESERFSQK